METTAKEKLKIPYGEVRNKNLVGAFLSASEVKYTTNKWRAISMFAESSCNMIVLMSAYITQSVITDLMGALTPDKGLYKHLIKVHARNANDKINETIESIINKDRDDAQVNYLYAYTDALDAKMRPRVQAIKKEIEKILLERGCKKANICAWTLTCEGLARMTCQLFINVMIEIKEMFRCDMSQKYIQYYIDDVYDELKGLVYELSRKFPEMKGIDAQNTPQTSKIFEEIDDDIRNAECLDAAADEANNEFDDERKQKNMERVEHILAEIGDEIEEHKTKYSV